MKFANFTIHVAVGICLCACNSKPGQQATSAANDTTTAPVDSTPTKEADYVSYEEVQRIDSALVPNTISDTGLAVLITKTTSIVIVPDEIHMRQQIRVDSEGFYSVADDFSYYTSMARDTLEKNGISQQSYNHQKRYLVFKGTAGTIYTIDGDKIQNVWGTILFNSVDTPVLWSGTDIAPTVKWYFKKE